jgi:hypothetical protein
MTVPESGKFTWDVLPSTRPFVGHAFGGYEPSGEAQTYTPTPDENKYALGAADPEAGSVERAFTLDGSADAVQVDLTWGVQAEDYDLELYRVLDDGTRVEAGDSGELPGTFEQELMVDPPAGNYVLRVIYYATAANDWTATIQPLTELPPANATEAFTFTCETPGGNVIGSREITVDRGERLDVNVKDCAKKTK